MLYLSPTLSAFYFRLDFLFSFLLFLQSPLNIYLLFIAFFACISFPLHFLNVTPICFLLLIFSLTSCVLLFLALSFSFDLYIHSFFNFLLIFFFLLYPVSIVTPSSSISNSVFFTSSPYPLPICLSPLVSSVLSSASLFSV